jgi:hypothetical protein
VTKKDAAFQIKTLPGALGAEQSCDVSTLLRIEHPKLGATGAFAEISRTTFFEQPKEVVREHCAK